MIQSNERIQKDDKFKTLSKSDILTAFENHIKSLERTFNDARQQQKAAKARRERHNRERYIELLQELKSQGKIKAGSKWINIHSLIQDDPRYVAMLGQSGSSPLDLFWDMVEEDERSLRGPRNDVLDVLDVSFIHIFRVKVILFTDNRHRTNVMRSPRRLHSKSSIL
jgi:pre-mRNA-processing factor 40